MRRAWSILVGGGSWMLCAGAAGSVAPLAVSPGEIAGAIVADRCPSFSWGAVEGATAFELVVYRVGSTAGEDTIVVKREVPGVAFVWTPSVGECFEPSHRYAWSVRAITAGGTTDWADPLLFEVAAVPSTEELEAVLEVVRRELAARKGGTGAPGGDEFVSEVDSFEDGSMPVASARPPGPGHGAGRRRAVGSAFAEAAAQLTVDGEVRTVDAEDDPRLWGRGRPGLVVWPTAADLPRGVGTGASRIEYGLSDIKVDWGSAANACPAGSWVCRTSEISENECLVVRPDDNWDGTACNGNFLDFSADEHLGWLAGTDGEGGDAMFESGDPFLASTCFSLPVWCCWQG